jgi:hypothetical protein
VPSFAFFVDTGGATLHAEKKAVRRVKISVWLVFVENMAPPSRRTHMFVGSATSPTERVRSILRTAFIALLHMERRPDFSLTPPTTS